MWTKAKNLLKRFVQWAVEDSEPDGYLTTQDSAPSLPDGVSYRLPVVIPGRIVALGQEATEAYLQEAYPQYKTQWGDPYLQGEPFAMLALANPLREWDFSTRRDVLEQCHLAWERNPLANAAVTYNRLFAVQNGMRRQFKNKAVQEAIEAFINNPENDFKAQEKSLLDTLQVDGELFLRFHGANPESLVMTSIPAWGIRAIKHELGFVRRAEEYLPSYTEDTGIGTGDAEAVIDPIPAREVLHVAINRKSYEQRGRPELFRLLPYLGGYREWLENRGRQNHYRGTVVYDVMLQNATAAQVSAKRSQYKEPPRGVSIAVHNQNETWSVLEGKVNAQDAAEDGRQMKLMIAAGARVPEYMLADGSNANLASATAQQLPAIRSFSEWQDVMIDQVWTPVFHRVLEAAGLDLDSEVPEQDSDGKVVEGKMIKVRDAFSIKYADLESTDPKNVSEALKIAVDANWMSNETAAGILPFDIDYPTEQRKIEVELEIERDRIAQGLIQMPLPFGQQGQNPMQDDNGNKSDSDKEQPSNGKQPIKQAA